MKIKKEEMAKLWKELQKLSQETQPIRFSYFIAKNKGLLKDEIDILNDLSKVSQEFIKYDNCRAALAKEMSDKDSEGNSIIQNNSYIITEHKEEFDNKLMSLRIEFKDAIEDTNKKIEEFNSILKEDYEFNGYKIKIDLMPEVINPELLELFMKVDLIED